MGQGQGNENYIINAESKFLLSADIPTSELQKVNILFFIFFIPCLEASCLNAVLFTGFGGIFILSGARLGY